MKLIATGIFTLLLALCGADRNNSAFAQLCRAGGNNVGDIGGVEVCWIQRPYTPDEYSYCVQYGYDNGFSRDQINEGCHADHVDW